MRRRVINEGDTQPGVTGPQRLLTIVTTLLLLGGLHAGPASAQDEAPDNKDCLRCHQMATLAYRDPGSGEIVDLSVDPKALSHSAHGELACSDCHNADYEQYPHPDRLKRERLACVGCHEEQDDAQARVYRFETIDEEFQHSIHVTSDAPEAADFSCHSCHDPHAFRNSEVGEDIAQIVRDDNAICLSCHEELKDPYRDPHLWLPKREKHREAVRCLDCHTPLTQSDQPVSHQILAGEDSNRDCVKCHSKAPELLNRLYQYRSETDLANKGWISKAVFNEAYVVGMSRNPVVDRSALAIIGITLLVLGAHGYGRYRAYRRSKEDQA
ncbi:nitrate reductase [Thiorhodococcus mannitoliphagus]|uniref:Nitrate reductase n=1 Tax=Thiorhodococcus mannitoliphagus TaxID=329406 RepID=A0A6P1DV82_9GAMM|nr:cytochrome c3 family protein [Thiorhodococcus mannitoliphagus]NEX20596.1 nitrate reductase [Thiorhodococcus mannitoliphagus]